MNLKEIRENWEKNLAEGLKVTHNVGEYKTVLVLLRENLLSEGSKYFVHRYFTLGGDWQISVDYDGEYIEEALKIVTEHFDDLYPTE